MYGKQLSRVPIGKYFILKIFESFYGLLQVNVFLRD